MAKHTKQTQIPFTFSKELQEEQKTESKPKPTHEQQIIIQQEEQTLKTSSTLFYMYSVLLCHDVNAVMSPNDSFRIQYQKWLVVLLKSYGTACPQLY